MRILVIDDHVFNLISAKKTLKGHEVTTCMDADKAARLLYPPRDKELNDLPLSWDVVLSDLLMPPPLRECGDVRHKFVDQEMVVGWAFALQAVLYGVKYAAVVTNLNHHAHPGSTLLDPLLSRWWEEDDRHEFNVNGATVAFYSDAPMIAVSDKPCVICEDESVYRCPGCSGIKKEAGKDWGKILKHLVGANKKEKGR